MWCRTWIISSLIEDWIAFWPCQPQRAVDRSLLFHCAWIIVCPIHPSIRWTVNPATGHTWRDTVPKGLLLVLFGARVQVRGLFSGPLGSGLIPTKPHTQQSSWVKPPEQRQSTTSRVSSTMRLWLMSMTCYMETCTNIWTKESLNNIRTIVRNLESIKWTPCLSTSATGKTTKGIRNKRLSKMVPWISVTLSTIIYTI